jgi:AraC family transcriptional regulator
MPLNIYHGTTEFDQVDRGLRLSVTSYTDNAVIPEHEHANAYICIGMAGGFVERSGKIERKVRAHDLIYHPPGHTHSDRFFGSGGWRLNIEMDANWLVGLSKAPGNMPVYAADPAIRRLGRAVLREWRNDGGAALSSVNELLLELLAKLRGPAERRYRRPPHWLLMLRDYLRTTYAENHRLDTLAHMAGVHPVHIAREFKRQFGCTVHDYLYRCRTEAACALLAGTELPLAEIALRLGFHSQSHFTRMFGVATGTTPGAYRRLARNGKR